MANLIWRKPPQNVLGVTDDRLSPYHKVWIMQGNTCVVGVIGEGTSKSVQANWSQPLQGDSVGNKLQKSGGLLQAETGLTTETTLSSTQIWSGNQPHSFSITLTLYARDNPANEVEGAISALERMQAPDLKGALPISATAVWDKVKEQFGGESSDDEHGNATGRIPGEVILNIGRTVIYERCIIQSVSVPLDGPKSPDGYLLSADVSLEVSTKTLLNIDEIY
ncbi:hypothetical protein [Endozoicomonas lisbonensis]|uniref:PmgG n=1 Tax=Endozoicomonas lisbonensis TaxID=3120522 RepID=A0ABV2SP86_9GAMM